MEKLNKQLEKAKFQEEIWNVEDDIKKLKARREIAFRR